MHIEFLLVSFLGNGHFDEREAYGIITSGSILRRLVVRMENGWK
jgi:hypothetical protein